MTLNHLLPHLTSSDSARAFVDGPVLDEWARLGAHVLLLKKEAVWAALCQVLVSSPASVLQVMTASIIDGAYEVLVVDLSVAQANRSLREGRKQRDSALRDAPDSPMALLHRTLARVRDGDMHGFFSHLKVFAISAENQEEHARTLFGDEYVASVAATTLDVELALGVQAKRSSSLRL